MEQWLINFTKEAESDIDLLDGKIRVRVLEKMVGCAITSKRLITCPLVMNHRSKVYNKPPK